MKPKTYRFRRFVAFAIDWNVSCLPILLLGVLLAPLAAEDKFPIPLLVPIVLAFPALFLFRERLFRGRSIGNRIMKLVILNRNTLQPLPFSALTVRNLMFLFLGGLEILLLLCTGATLGDRVSEALVVREDEIPAEPPRKTPVGVGTVIITVLAAVGVFILFIALILGVVLAALDSVRDEPHYALAYDYLISSETFAELDAREDQIIFNGYSRSSSMANGEIETEARFTFLVAGHSLTVICHESGNGWYVCEECTKFK